MIRDENVILALQLVKFMVKVDFKNYFRQHLTNKSETLVLFFLSFCWSRTDTFDID